VGAQIVFGDQVKADTYRRLNTVPSLVDLDRAFGQQVLPFIQMLILPFSGSYYPHLHP
jgi:hypothetical protein